MNDNIIESGKKQTKGELENVRVRIAPSPTGPLHIGTARTALFNWLFARQNNGKFILRIEDTDLERSDPKWTDEILDSLSWLGLHWDEGPLIADLLGFDADKRRNYIGDYGPYKQTERLDIYEKYIKQLLDDENAFYCFCKEEQLEKERQEMMANGLPPKYSGHCRNLNKEEIEVKIKNGEKSIIRLKMTQKQIVFDDLLRGRLEFDADLIGDIAIAKNFRTPLYNFAVVIDDYEMKISHVIRGEDHTSNTPKQIAIIEALGLYIPKYLHLPLILSFDRSKLSKRHGAVSVREYREIGYLPETLLNFMSLLGWHPQDNRELFSAKELIEEFDIDRVQKAGAIFNIQKLDWLNAEYLRRMTIGELINKTLPHLLKAGLVEKGNGFYLAAFGRAVNLVYFEKMAVLIKERLKKLSDIAELADYFFKRIDYDKKILGWKNMPDDEVSANLKTAGEIIEKINEADFAEENLQNNLMPEAEKRGRGEFLWPLRAALSGKRASCGPFEIMDVLGKEESLFRIKKAIEKLKN